MREDGVWSRRRLDPATWGCWGSSQQLSAWVLRATRNHWLGVTSSSPNKLSRPFSKDCSVSSLQISHWFLGPCQSILKVGRRAVSFSNPGKWRRGCLCLALLLICVSPCTCVGAQRWGPEVEGSPGTGLRPALGYKSVLFCFLTSDSCLDSDWHPSDTTHPRPCWNLCFQWKLVLEVAPIK